MELRDYQKKAVEWGNSHDVGYFAVDMSMGKTAILLHMIDRPTIIFAPLTVAAITWPEEIAKWRPDLKYQVLHGKERYLKPGLDVYIINYDGISWLSKAWTIEMTDYMRDGMIIWDEMTKLKDSSSKRFKLIKDFRRIFKRAYALSGTPAPNGVRDLFSQYYLLDYGERLGKRKTRFMMTYHTQIDRFIWAENNGAMDIVTDKIKDITFRLDANDYLKLEPYIYSSIPAYLPAASMQRYKEFQTEFVTTLTNESTITAESAGVLSLRLRQLLQGSIYDEQRNIIFDNTAKVDTLFERIEEAAGDPMLVPIQFRSELIEIRKRLPQAPAIIGGTPTELSKQYVHEWNKGNLPVLFCHPNSLSHGLNLQYGGHRICWLGLTWSLETYQQLNGRLRRPGQTKPVLVDHIIIPKTVDDRVLSTLTRKDATQQQLLNALKEFANESGYL